MAQKEKGKSREVNLPPLVGPSSTPRAFNYLIQGDSEIFTVTVPLDSNVNGLRDLIREKHKYGVLSNVDAASLGLWKVDIDLHAQDKHSLRQLTINKDDNGAEELTGWKRITEYWPTQPANDRLHILVELRAVGAAAAIGIKRPRVKDPTDDICEALIRPFDVTPKLARDIVPLIKEPLLRKLPVMDDFFDNIEVKHPSISELLCPGTGELALDFTVALKESTGQAAAQKGSEDMLHAPVDSLLRFPLTTICESIGTDLPIELDRNRTDEGTSIKQFSHPDFLLWLGDALMLWGEEKADSGAKEDLDRKFKAVDPVYFGEVQFMICYTMNRPKICFYAADGSPEGLKKPDPFIPLTYELNLTNFKHRFEVLRTVINIARILVTIKNILPTIAYPLGKKRKTGNTLISFNVDSVEKKLPVNDLPYSKGNQKGRINFLIQMYIYAKNHRGLVQVKNVPKLDQSKTHYKVVLETRGIRKRPAEEDEVRAMTKDLVSGLAWLHCGNYLHRDIQFPNIIYDPTKREYVLIDFEHGGRHGKNKGKNIDDSTWLKDWDDGTLDHGAYTKTSEMYQLGKMLRNEFGYMVLSKHGNDFIQRSIEEKIAAQQLLQHEWIHDLP